MLNRRSFLAAAAIAAALAGPAAAAEPIRAVASFSILGDIVARIAGERVSVTTLVGPNADTHVYEPKPSDGKALSEAKLLVLNGFGFEGWMPRLEKSSGFKGATVVATKGVASQTMSEEEGGKTKTITDPHAWQSLANGRVYARNIADGLVAIDPEGRAVYEANLASYLAEIDAVEKDVVATLGRVPAAKRRLITSHDAFGYFGKAYGFAFIAPQGVSTETEPSAKDVAKIIKQIKAEKIPAVFIENISDRRMIEQIARETGAVIGGTLYSDALSAKDGPAGTYLDIFRSNVAALAKAFQS